jgi:DNA (cytosine-5)-methyltransferase 3A
MNVLSLFDGISCARVALDRAGIEVNAYMSSEIDKNAIKVSEKNYSDIIRVGSVLDLEVEGQVDLLIGGSPCTDLSIAKKDRQGLEGNQSSLFWEYVRIKKECKPKWFILENVASMPKKDKDIITKEMGVEPVMFNASLVSAQSRKRLFWTNIPFDLPKDKGIVLKDILQTSVDEKFYINKAMKETGKTTGKVGYIGKGEQYGQGGQAHRVYAIDGKTPTLSSGAPLIKLGHTGSKERQTNRIYDPEGKAPTQLKGSGVGGALPTLIQEETRIRKLTPIECERLQGLPDNYTEGVATTNRYRCLGNAFNVDVVAHILTAVRSPH